MLEDHDLSDLTTEFYDVIHSICDPLNFVKIEKLIGDEAFISVYNRDQTDNHEATAAESIRTAIDLSKKATELLSKNRSQRLQKLLATLSKKYNQDIKIDLKAGISYGKVHSLPFFNGELVSKVVNLAKRMSDSSGSGKIRLSTTAADHLEEFAKLSRETVEVKNMGKQDSILLDA